MKSLSIAWTQDIRDKEKKKEVEDLIRNSTTALSRLRSIIQKKEKELLDEDLKLPDIAELTYALRMSHRQGQRKAIKDILDLLSFLE